MSSIHPFNFYVFRRPLLPVDALLRFLDHTATGGDMDSSLRDIFRRADLQEAVYHASPQLHHRLQRWLRKPDFPREEALYATLLKYLIRASTRCTPYGTFAGCLSPGQWGAHTEVTFDEQNPTKKYTRLRTDRIVPLQVHLTQQNAIQQQSTFYSNDSLYQWGGHYRYTFYTTKQGTRHYALCSVDATPHLEVVLGATVNGASFSMIVDSLVQENIPSAVAEDFIRTLIDEQVLVSEWQTKATGEEALERLIGQFTCWENTSSEVCQRLEEVQALLASTSIHQHHDRLATMVVPEFDQDKQQSITHTDMFFMTTRNVISQSAMHSLTETLRKLMVIDQGNFNPTLEDFKERFYRRYEEQEIPLLHALDSELGVGYGKSNQRETSDSLMQEAIDLSHGEEALPVQWDYWKNFVLRKYSEALSSQQSNIRLQEEDLDMLRVNHHAATHTPATLTAWGSLLADSAAEVDRGNFQFHLRQLAGPSGVSLLGRFCYGDEMLEEQAKQLVRAEEQAHPEVIFAEIVHLPDEREGIVASRPTLRRYEIPVLTRPSVTPQFQIPLSDLMISVKNGQHLVLRSRRHNKRVIPRLSVAHNFQRGHYLYRFLGDVQFDEQSLNVRWHWGVLEKQAFLPRVSYRNVILSRATWTLITDDYPTLKAKETDIQQFGKELRRLPRLPRYVQWVENDNELLIDQENPSTLRLLQEAFCKKEIIILKEYLSLPSCCLLQDQAGHYTNEVIIPFVGNPDPYHSTQSNQSIPTIQRDFTLGSEWLYLKLYTGAQTADKLLGTAVKELTERLLSQELIDRWFFIRYADPNTHLRLRFHQSPVATDRFYSELLPLVYQWSDQLQQSGLIQQMQTGAYQRELERYGNDMMEASEHLFFYDSQAVVNFLNSPERSNEEARWQLAFGGVDRLLHDFRYTLLDKVRLLGSLRQAYLDEFAVTRALQRQLDTNYRVHATSTLEGLATRYITENPELHQIILERSWAGSEAVAEIMTRTSDWDRLLASYLHMFLNRLFVTDLRQHELLVYYYLEKYYRSVVGRNKNTLANLL